MSKSQIRKAGDYLVVDIPSTTKDKKLMVKIEGGTHESLNLILGYIRDFVINQRLELRSNETFALGCWILKFVGDSEDILNIFELDPNTQEYIEGAAFSSEVFSEQIQIGIDHNLYLDFPSVNSKIVYSDGVLEGLQTDGIRYPSPNHMSGWWLTTSLYNGNIETLKQIHLYDFAASRPDLLKFLALPFKCRFNVSASHSAIWLDDTIED